MVVSAQTSALSVQSEQSGFINFNQCFRRPVLMERRSTTLTLCTMNCRATLDKQRLEENSNCYVWSCCQCSIQLIDSQNTYLIIMGDLRKKKLIKINPTAYYIGLFLAHSLSLVAISLSLRTKQELSNDSNISQMHMKANSHQDTGFALGMLTGLIEIGYCQYLS